MMVNNYNLVNAFVLFKPNHNPMRPVWSLHRQTRKLGLDKLGDLLKVTEWIDGRSPLSTPAVSVTQVCLLTGYIPLSRLCSLWFQLAIIPKPEKPQP